MPGRAELFCVNVRNATASGWTRTSCKKSKNWLTAGRRIWARTRANLIQSLKKLTWKNRRNLTGTFPSPASDSSTRFCGGFANSCLRRGAAEIKCDPAHGESTFQQFRRFGQRLVEPACVLAAAASVVRLAAALAADNRCNRLNNFSGLNFCREIG